MQISSRFAPCLIVLLACIVLRASAQDAGRSPSASTRGIAGVVELAFDGALRAKPGQNPESPILVRVQPGAVPGTHRIEYIGSVSGEYDLSGLIERTDGRPAEGLGPIKVRIESRLPLGHGLDLFGEPKAAFSLTSHYREVIVFAFVAWCAVPMWFVARRMLRRKPVTVDEPPPPARTVADELREALEAAASHPLSIKDKGRLELLLLRYLRDSSLKAPEADVTSAVHALRAHPATRETVLAVERWLHGPRGEHDAPMQTLSAVRAGLGATDRGGEP